MPRPTAVFKINYHGHSCFSVSNDYLKLTVIFDPFEPRTGKFSLTGVQGDIVLCSHDHFDHNYWKGVAKWDAVHFVGLVGERNVKGVKISGILTYHDRSQGRERGQNSIYLIQMGDGIFVHLGDLGHVLDEKQVGEVLKFGRPHVVFVPVGGVYTIEPDEAVAVVKQINPHIAIPMHFHHKKLNQIVFRKLKPVDDFLSLWDGPVFDAKSSSIEINVDELPEETTVYVLSPP